MTLLIFGFANTHIAYANDGSDPKPYSNESTISQSSEPPSANQGAKNKAVKLETATDEHQNAQENALDANAQSVPTNASDAKTQGANGLNTTATDAKPATESQANKAESKPEIPSATPATTTAAPAKTPSAPATTAKQANKQSNNTLTTQSTDAALTTQANNAPKYDTPIAAGTYVIRSGVGSDYVLDVSGGSHANGANVQIYTYNRTAAQKWKLTYDSNGLYSNTSVVCGKMLDLSGARVANGSNIHQSVNNGTQAQKWIITKSGSRYTIASVINKNYVLDVSGGWAANGQNVQLYKANGTAAQMFTFALVNSKPDLNRDTELQPGDYIIQSGIGSQYVLDVSGGSKANSANIQIYAYNGTGAQKWRVTRDKEGYYSFSNIQSGKMLDLSGADARYGGNVHQYASNKTKAQKWIVKSHSGQYAIQSAVDPLFVLDVSGAHAANGTNVQVWVDNSTQAQRFMFIPLAASLPKDGNVEDGVYTIALASNTKYVLDVSGGSLKSSANVQLFEANKTYAQRWGFVRGKNGLYSIFNMGSGKMLDVYGGSKLAKANIQQYRSNDSKAQQWAISQSSKAGTFTIVNAGSGLALSAASGNIKNSVNIQTFPVANSNTQLFKLTRLPLIENGCYAFAPAYGEGQVLDLPNNTPTEGAKLQAYEHNDTLAQHILVSSQSNNHYTLSIVGSGKNITDQNSAIVQKQQSNNQNQMWTAHLVKGGVAFKNVATNKYFGVSSTKIKNGTSINSSNKADLTRAFGITACDLISRGIYEFSSLTSKSGRVLDVADGSWSNGANAQIYEANGTNAQKFIVAPVRDGYYKITAVLSGLALSATQNNKAGANVSFNTWKDNNYQLWQPMLSNGGITFQNKGSKLVLGVTSGKDANGANVDQEASNGSAAQKWRLTSTRVNMADMGSISKLVRSVSGSRNLTSSMKIDQGRWNALLSALSDCWNRGFDVGFLMTDLQSGNYVSINADKVYYGASTMKAAYVTWIFQERLEWGWTSWDDVGYLIVPTIANSNNDTYAQLRYRFGNDGFNSWLHAVGLGGWGDSWYAYYTPRELQLMWARILAYEQSGSSYVGTWRATFNHSYYSTINEALGGYKTTYTKPGWYPRGTGYDALADSGIVESSDGSRYLLTIMSDINCYGDQELERRVVRAVDSIFNAYGGLN